MVNNNVSETIHIKCPNCGKKLILKNKTSQVAGKRLTCPACGKSSVFEEYESVDIEPQEGGRTEIRSNISGKAVLVDDATGREYQLNVGVNSVGRDARSCNADIRIVTEDFSISRMHAYISVFQAQGGSVRCGISNAQNKFPTKVNGVEVEQDDVISVMPGDRISMAGSDFHIEIK